MSQSLDVKVVALSFERAVLYFSPHQAVSAYTLISHALRFAEKCLLYTPRTKSKTLGERAFSIAGSRKWNTLPLVIRQAESVVVFKSRLTKIKGI